MQDKCVVSMPNYTHTWAGFDQFVGAAVVLRMALESWFTKILALPLMHSGPVSTSLKSDSIL